MRLVDLLPPADDATEDTVLEAISAWAEDKELALYPHQEEALLEVLAGNNVIVSTPTGSGKSLIALGAHAAELALGGRTFYTAPLKALVSEKFFALIEEFGAANVGMMTGDSAVNRDAPIICCTAEILANIALREGADADVTQVVMDEFHFYADPQRGWAWQVPLLTLPQAQFILMSATLGDVEFFAKDLTARTGRQTAIVSSAERPIPLDYEYSTEPLTDLVPKLLQQGKAPVYVVHFTQASAIERAQALLSVPLATRAERDQIAAEIGHFRFAKGFGATLSKLVRHGVGVHHAGMLPRYRRLVERLTQAGLLKVICGTDTLGVGINVPIRTVVLTSLVKYDGVSMRHLSAREFHQIAGRAGRAGFDTEGTVIVQAPEHVIENAKALAKAGDDEKKRRKITRKQAPKGQVNWTESTYLRLRDAEPERLTSQMRVTHGMALQVLSRPGDPVPVMYRLLTDNHEPERPWNPLLRQACQIYLSLKATGVVEHLTHRDAQDRYLRLTVEIPEDFALNQPLSAFALAALELLTPGEPGYELDVVSVFEATLEDPRAVLFAQEHRARGEAIGALKAEGYDYDERMEMVEEITYPKPLAAELEAAYDSFRREHPWVSDYELKPKSVVREMYERGQSFADLIATYQLARAEGAVLRYLTDAYRALRGSVPPWATTPELEDLIEWLGESVRAVDSSLLEEWEALRSGADAPAPQAQAADDGASVRAPSANPRALRASIRSAMFRLVELAAREDYAGLAAYAGRLAGAARTAGSAPAGPAARVGAADPSPDGIAAPMDPGRWADPEAWADALEAYWDEHDEIGIDQAARGGGLIDIVEGPSAWRVRQVLADPAGDHDWSIEAKVGLPASDAAGELRLAVTSVAQLNRFSR